jgi:peptidyl-prolyl cis-trans isomerase A (cyclophilin A)
MFHLNRHRIMRLRTLCVVSVLILSGCALGGGSAEALLNPSGRAMTVASPATYRVMFETTKGNFIIEADRALAPQGSDRFYNLVRNGFYDGAYFFRAVRGFVVQFGIPADPNLTDVWKQQRIPDDTGESGSNVRGAISFATAGPNTRTYQLFINLADNSRLDGQGFAAFARVIEGMEVVDSLYTGYGDGVGFTPGPDQSRIESEGASYLEREFPLLDHIHRARIVRPRRWPTSWF